jgi:trimeric autotransporter adhesin
MWCGSTCIAPRGKRLVLLPAVSKIVFATTQERKEMSKTTILKRIALVAVASLGVGMLSVAPSNAAVSSETLTATASATSVAVGDSVTVAVVNEFTSSASDTTIISVSITNPNTGGSVTPYWQNGTDTVNVISSQEANATRNGYQYIMGGIGSDTHTSGAGVAKFNRITGTFILSNFTAAGTYYVSVYNTGADGISVARKSVNLTITVTRPTFSAVRLYTSTDTTTAMNARLRFATSSDSTVTLAAGSATSPTYAATILATGLASGDTLTTTGANICTAQAVGYCEVTVTVSGPGLVSLVSNNAGARVAEPAKSVTMKLYNGATLTTTAETLAVFADGTAGVGTITFSSGSTTLGTKTITFQGAAASATLFYGDTIVAVGANTTAVKAYVLDTAGNRFTGSLWIYSSDTSIISESATACTYSSTLLYHTCGVTGVDTGTATVKVSNRSSQSAAASTTQLATWFSSTLSFTVRGTSIQSFTATFDKATYGPGDKAILTITAKDRAGNTMASGAVTNAFSVTSNRAFTDITTPTTYTPGTSGAEDGVETRVVYMPTTGGDFTYTMKPGAGSLNVYADKSAVADVVAKATVVDPVQDAQNKAIADSQAAADAATDAALQAIDAANAATDAANLAAEAADAATVAAEEAKDAADAATAAVEALATQITQLTASVQAQIRSLANTVAKIAKKVKA